MEDNQAAVEAAAADGRDFVTETDMQAIRSTCASRVVA